MTLPDIRIDPEQALMEIDISPKMREYINLTWHQYDTNRDGLLSFNELKRYLKAVLNEVNGAKSKRKEKLTTDQEIVQIFNLDDRDQSQKVDKLTFVNIVKNWISM